MITEQMIEAAKAGDKPALEALWEQTKAFASAVSRRYFPETYADADDLQQCGYLGFHTAVMQHTGRYRFLSLVQWCIQRECQKVLGLYGSRRYLRAESLDIVLPDGEHTLSDLIMDESLPESGTELEASELVRDVRAAVAELPERERGIVERHWFDDATLADIGKDLGVSSERVRKLEAGAFDRLRNDPVLRTYATNPNAMRYVARSGLAHFMHTGASSVEHEALRHVYADAKRHQAKQKKSGYAALLASLTEEDYLTASEYRTILSAHP